jgi:hypothetical protein
MLQIKNTERVIKRLNDLTRQFQMAFEQIDKDKHDNSGIFRDVRTGKDNLMSIRPFDKDSASNSLYFGVESTDSRFFSSPVKAFVKAYSNSISNEAMRVETCIYKNFISDKLKPITPNIVHYYGSVSGFPLGNYTSKDILDKGWTAADKGQTLELKTRLYNLPKAIFNFTEYLPMARILGEFYQKDDLSITFFDFADGYKKKDVTETDMAQVIFQIVYTLNLFEQLHLHHNDIHAGNVLVVKNTSDREFLYAVNMAGQIHYVYMKPKFIAKIFDYDRGYSENKVCYPDNNNVYLPACYRTGRGKNSEDCYEKGRLGYDILRLFTSISGFTATTIKLFFSTEFADVMKKFDRLKGVGDKDMTGIGAKSVEHYMDQLCVNATKNKWFEVATDPMILQKHISAELYSPDVKSISTVAPPKPVLYTRNDLEMLSVAELGDIIQQAGLSFEPSKDGLIEFILKEKIVKTRPTTAQRKSTKSASRLSETSLKKKRVKSLVEMLRQRKLAVGGKKSQLVKRILDNQPQRAVSPTRVQPQQQAVSPMSVDPRRALCKTFINDRKARKMHVKNPYTGRKMLADGALAKSIYTRCIIEFPELSV